MIIQQLKLNNIRSYTDATIDFPESSVLLSGDIGSGKSSILLALEFALFGLSKGEISGEQLLRNGARKGAVELKLKVEGKGYIIKRCLKKTGDSVVQDTGYVISEGVKKEATAVELKSHVLHMLGYPAELLTKKSLIYRYTVYTPQEDMKRILLDDRGYRLDTLRKIFGIDKYKRIRENSEIFLKALREKKNLYEGSIMGYDKIKQDSLNEKQKAAQISEKLKTIKPKLDSAVKEFEKQKLKVDGLQKKADEKRKYASQLEICSARLEELLKQRNNNKRELDMIELRAKELSEELEKIVPVKPEQTPEEVNKIISAEEKKLLELNLKLKEFELKTARLNDEIRAIIKLSKCPTCRQEVSSGYKKEIEASHNSEIERLKNEHEKLGSEKGSKSKNIEKLKDDSYNLHKKHSDYQILLKDKERAKRSLEEIAKRKQQLEQMQSDAKAEIGALNMKKIELSEKLGKAEDVDIEPEKKKLEELRDAKESLQIEDATLRKEISLIENIVKKYEEELKEKDEIRGKIKNIDEYYNWIEAFFAPLMSTMEKHVLGQVHNEFNSLFQEWFSVLLDDETLNVRLDDEFTPVIEQNGYEIDLYSMSGGEKTSIALAYRLALNKVINNLITTINTKDILILDEPTDGFSTEQLDRVRDVLERLGLKQIIIVSHESKIESFVDYIIKVSKNEHVSTVSPCTTL
jgi:exonuclease SbcC